MKLTITKTAPWTIRERTKTFSAGQTVEVGVDVPDEVGQQMLEAGYAVKQVTRETLVTEKKPAPEPTEQKAAPKGAKKRTRSNP